MTDAIEGRWWLDFMKRAARDPAGNEFILSGGVMSVAKSEHPAGTYDIEPGVLTLTVNMPPIPDEGDWRVEAKFLLLDPANPPASLPGILRAIDCQDRVLLNGSPWP